MHTVHHGHLCCCCCCQLQADLAGVLLQQEQQEANMWNNLLAKLPQPMQTTAYMAQRDLVIPPLS